MDDVDTPLTDSAPVQPTDGPSAPRRRRASTKQPASPLRKTAAQRQRECRERKRKRLAGEALDLLDDLTPADVGTPKEAVAKSTARKAMRAAARAEAASKGPKRAPGWLREMLAGTEDGLSSSRARELARMIFARDGLPYLQEVISDPNAKDTDRARATDIVAKVAIGYITPDMIGSEDAPDLPPPIIELSEGDLPGEGRAAIADDALSGEGGEGDDRDDAGGPQLDPSVSPAPAVASAGPVPFVHTDSGGSLHTGAA